MVRNRSFLNVSAKTADLAPSEYETAVRHAKRQQLRAKHRLIRERMSADEVRERSRSICSLLLQSGWYRKTSAIYGYYCLGNEADCRLFLKQALSDGKLVALPMTERNGGCGMEFYRITSLSQVEEGNFHVMEPVPGLPLVQREEAAVLVPGLVFDRRGGRLGYGKGYYDRYFARFGNLKRIGLAFENQMEEEIPVTALDIGMDYIYTEEQCYETRNDGG